MSERSEPEFLFRKKKNRTGNRRLCFCRLIKVDDLPDFAPAQQALKRFFAFFDRADELRDGIIAVGLSFDALTFEIEPACEPNPAQHVRSLVRNKVKDAVLLPNPRCQHMRS